MILSNSVFYLLKGDYSLVGLQQQWGVGPEYGKCIAEGITGVCRV